MIHTFSFVFNTEIEAWAACPKNASSATVRPDGFGKFELRYSL
jgi:hypothetical protein